MAYDAQGHKLTTYRGERGYWQDDEEEPYFVRAKAVSSSPSGSTASRVMEALGGIKNPTYEQVLDARRQVEPGFTSQKATPKASTSTRTTTNEPKTWSELLKAAGLPATFDTEFGTPPGKTVKISIGGKTRDVSFTPMSNGRYSATYLDEYGARKGITQNTQPGAGGDPDSMNIYDPRNESFWTSAVRPLLPIAAAVVGGNLAAGNFGSLGSTASAGSTVGGGLADTIAFEQAAASVPSWGAGVTSAPSVVAAVTELAPALAPTAEGMAGFSAPVEFGGVGSAGVSAGGAGGMAGILEKLTGIVPGGIPGDSGLASTIGKALGTGSATEAAGKGGILETLSKVLGGGGTDGKGLNDVLNGLISGYMDKNNASDLAEALKYAVDKADPFASQRPGYQNQLKQVTSDPNLFKTDAGSKLREMINDPNLMNTPYGQQLKQMFADPNLMKNDYGDRARSLVNDPNYLESPMSKQLAQMAENPDYLNNQYGVEAGNMINDPDRFINTPLMKALRDSSLNATQARLAAQIGGDQGSISARDTLNKSLLSAQAPTIQDYFKSLVSGDVGTQGNKVNYFNSMANATQNDISGKNSFLQSLISGDVNTNQNTLEFLKSLGTMDIGTNANTINEMSALGNIDTNQNRTTQDFINSLSGMAGANANPGVAGQIASTAATTNAGAQDQVNGDWGYAINSLPKVFGQLSSLFGNSNKTSNSSGLQSLFNF